METYDHQNTDTGAALEAGQSLALAQQHVQKLGIVYTESNPLGIPGGIPFTINADGKAESLESLLEKPVRQKFKPLFHNVASFIAFVNLYKAAGTLIFARVNVTGGTFHAALDMPQKEDTSWLDRSATFTLQTTEDWKAWVERNKKWMSQEDFVQFVETHRHVFSDPSSATMLEIAMSLEATIKGNYKSAFRNDNGDRTIIMDMSSDATFGKSESRVAVPQEITIIIVPFEGQAPVQQSAFLRFRPTNEGVKFQYELQQVEETIRASAEEASNKIVTETGLPVLDGILAP